MASDLQSGAIQLAIDLPPAQIKGLRSDKNSPRPGVRPEGLRLPRRSTATRGPSGGNPVLRDWKFRNALNWAVDKQKLVTLAYYGYATPGSSLFEPNFYDPSLDWHWTPPASEAYTFDLAKAGDMLTAAGYPLRNGVRLNKQGKPIVLRLWARTDSPQSQVMGKLITGWFSQLGLKIQYSVHDDATLSDGQLNYVGKTYKPDYDMYIWEWEPSGSDPQRRLGYFTTDQIQNQQRRLLVEPAVRRALQGRSRPRSTSSSASRSSGRWSRSSTSSPPTSCSTTPSFSRAGTPPRGRAGSASLSPTERSPIMSDNVDNYRLVGPRAAAAAAGGMSAGAIAAIVVGRRGRGRRRGRGDRAPPPAAGRKRPEIARP